MKDVVGQGGQADLEPGGGEAAEKTVVVVDHGVMPHRGQFGRRSRSPEVRLDPRSLFVQQPPQSRKEDPPQRIVEPAGRIDQLQRAPPGELRGPPHLAKIDRAGNHFHTGIQLSGTCQQRPRIDSHQAGRRKVLGQHGQLLGLGKGPAGWPNRAGARRSCRPGHRAPARPPRPPCAAIRPDRAGRCGRTPPDRPRGHRAARPCFPA